MSSMDTPASFSLSRLARRWSSHPFLITPQATIAYGELIPRIHTLSRYLEQAGISPKAPVALWGNNSPLYLITLLALWKIGAVAAPLSTRFPEARLPRLLGHIGSRQCLVLPGVPLDSPFPGIQTLPLPPDLFPSPPSTSLPEIDIPLSHDATIIFTSGSTGMPKAALHTLANHYYSALGSNRNIPFGPGDRWLLALPLYHVGGLAILFRALVGGGAVALPEPEMPLHEAIERLKVTHLSLVATQLYRLLAEERGRQALSRLKALLVGGSAIPPALIREAIAAGVPLHTTYGCTEMASQVTTTPPGAPPEALMTSGKVLPYRELKLAPDGEILVRGQTRFRGYIEKGKLVQPFDEEGWYATGDIGRLDARGYLTVPGRKDHMFISGGENIHPEEIERALAEIPGVEQAVVVAVEHPEFGHRPVAFIRMAAGKPLSPTDLRTTLTRQLPRFKIPDRFFPWPEHHPPGIKPDREFLRKLAGEYF
ncbi:MAG: o-succinylbenzoate--CoA ligase [Calditrichaeota bacterium]|nr:MAG: o-succinylbenzoate--CoA ligase [Calditrichota bacterium]